VAAYVRAGFDLQAGQAPDYPKQQLERVRKHVREKGWELPEEDIFRDDGYSGTILGRPGLDALRDRAWVRGLEVVVVLSPDRLARNGKSTRWSSSKSSRRTAAGLSLWRDR
jgi:DNA invertase Pin-like site-specific DNA recombinase